MELFPLWLFYNRHSTNRLIYWLFTSSFFFKYETFRRVNFQLRYPHSYLSTFSCVFLYNYIYINVFFKNFCPIMYKYLCGIKYIIIKPTCTAAQKKQHYQQFIIFLKSRKNLKYNDRQCQFNTDREIQFNLFFRSAYLGYLCFPLLDTDIWHLPRKYISVFVQIKGSVLVPAVLLGNNLLYFLH